MLGPQALIVCLCLAAARQITSFQHHSWVVLPQVRRRFYCARSPLHVTPLAGQIRSADKPTTPISENIEQQDFPWNSRLIEQANCFLSESQGSNTAFDRIEKSIKDANAKKATSRRMLFAVAAFATGTAIAGTVDGLSSNAETLGKLKWEATPVNKRTGVTVFDAEKDGYNVLFVTYETIGVN